MINIRKLNQLGKGDHGWLKSNFHFSFADYFSRDNMNFGQLRVINDDLISPHMGFDTHPHQNMEIITYVRSGAISHKDNMGNKGVTKAGDVQVMSAGTGVYHSEYNNTDEQVSLYQIWIMPNEKGVKPRWDQEKFPSEPVTGELPVLVSGRNADQRHGVLFIHQDAAIYGGKINKSTIVTNKIKHQAYILISEGEVEIEGKKLTKGDGAEITKQSSISVKALSDAEILILDVPPRG
ncbi:MAG: pirin family protein [Rhizobiales bacterium]|nr:pirin family protein [Hyphomicrobiales bacterium]NRB13017.1 pirin family protein [Hyphomicrobiales bacterium]